MAKTSYVQVLEHNPSNAKALQQLGWLCYKARDDNAAAVAYLKKAVAADGKDAQGWYMLGRAHMADSGFEDAYRAYESAV